MEIFESYLSKIMIPEHRDRMESMLRWVGEAFPELEAKIAWNQPMFTHHGTFIIGFSVSKKHIAVAPEREGINRFTQAIEQAGYDHTQELIRIRWDQPLDTALLSEMITFNLQDKAECNTFWRKRES